MASPAKQRPEMRHSVRALAHPLFGVLSQVLNSTTNAGTALVASYALTPHDFGRFALSYAVVLVILAGGRGLIGGSIVTHLPAVSGAERRSAALSALGTTWLVGAASTIVLAGAAVALPVLWWFIPWVGVALVQDAGRFIFIAERRAGHAFALDSVWALVQGGAVLVFVLGGGELSIGAVTITWGLGALAGTMTLVVMFRAVAGDPRPWLRSTRDIGGWWTATAILGQVEVYSVLFVTQVLLSETAVGELRSVQLITAQPAATLAAASFSLAIPAFARLGPHAPSAAYSQAARRVWIVLLPAVGYLGLVVAASGPLVDLILPQYSGSEHLTLPVAMLTLTGVLCVPALALMLARRHGATVFMLQLARMSGIVAGAAVGGAAAGLDGLAWGQVVGAVVPLVATLVAARRMVLVKS